MIIKMIEYRILTILRYARSRIRFLKIYHWTKNKPEILNSADKGNMKLIKFYCYLDYQTFNFFKNVLKYNKRMASMASGYTIGLSLISLVYSLDLITRKVFDVAGIFTNNYRIFGLVTVIILFNFMVIFSCNSQELEASNPAITKRQPVRTFFSLLYVFGPIFLMIILMSLEF